MGILPRRQLAQEKKAEDVGRGCCAAGMRQLVVNNLAPLAYVPSLFASLTHLIATESALTWFMIGALVYDYVQKECLQYKSATMHMFATANEKATAPVKEASDIFMSQNMLVCLGCQSGHMTMLHDPCILSWYFKPSDAVILLMMTPQDICLVWC